MNAQRISRADVVRLLGDIEDHKITEILATEASLEQLEEVAMWIAQQDAVMGELRKPFSGVCARIYEIVAGDEEFPGDENRR